MAQALIARTKASGERKKVSRLKLCTVWYSNNGVVQPCAKQHQRMVPLYLVFLHSSLCQSIVNFLKSWCIKIRAWLTAAGIAVFLSNRPGECHKSAARKSCSLLLAFRCKNNITGSFLVFSYLLFPIITTAENRWHRLTRVTTEVSSDIRLLGTFFLRGNFVFGELIQY